MNGETKNYWGITGKHSEFFVGHSHLFILNF